MGGDSARGGRVGGCGSTKRCGRSLLRGFWGAKKHWLRGGLKLELTPGRQCHALRGEVLLWGRRLD